MSAKEHIEHIATNRSDAFCNIPHPSGHGFLTCGAFAWQKFDDIGDRVTELDRQLKGRVHPSAAKKAVINAFVNRVLREERDVLREETVRLVVNDAAIALKESLATIEHYFPCVLFLYGGPDKFEIGPVTFSRRRKFFSGKRSALRQSVQTSERLHVEDVERAIEGGFPRDQAHTPTSSRQFVRHIQADALRTYRGYPWVASVRIVRCDEKVSEEVAAHVVETALNVIRVFLGANRTEQIRLAWSRGDALRTAHLYADEDGTIHPRVGSRSIGPVGSENWHDGLFVVGNPEFNVFCSALRALVDPNELVELHARFIDSINWFGDAATDTEPTASVVKYASAIERLLFGRYEPGRTRDFAKRIKLIFDEFDCVGKEHAYTNASEIYKIRSTLLHGSRSPRDLSARRLAITAEQLARTCLICAADLYPMIFRLFRNPGAKELDEVMAEIAKDGVEPLLTKAGFSRSQRSVVT